MRGLISNPSIADGLTVPFALAAGISGALTSSHIVVAADLAEIAAGSIAMGLGGYLAAKSAAEHFFNERRREEQEMVVKAAELLDWVTTPGGRVEMTVGGRQFLAADIATRQQQFNAKLRDLFVFDMILQMLQHSTSNEVDEAMVLSQLALTFPHERPQRLLRTVVAWARYAALFKYSSTRRVLHGSLAQILRKPVGLHPMAKG